jgi:hypothetical protein
MRGLQIKFSDWGPMRKGTLVVIKEPARPPQRTVLYVKQRSAPILLDHSVMKNASFALSTDSLLHYSFSIFRESCHNCSHRSFPAKNVSAYSIDSFEQQRITEHNPRNWDCRLVFGHFISKAYVEDGLMKVDSENPDSFVVALDTWQPERISDIIIP